MLKIKITKNKLTITGHCRTDICNGVSMLTDLYALYKPHIIHERRSGRTVLHDYDEFIFFSVNELARQFPNEVKIISAEVEDDDRNENDDS